MCVPAPEHAFLYHASRKRLHYVNIRTSISSDVLSITIGIDSIPIRALIKSQTGIRIRRVKDRISSSRAGNLSTAAVPTKYLDCNLTAMITCVMEVQRLDSTDDESSKVLLCL